MKPNLNNVQSSYNLVAEEYAKQFRNELDNKPFDRKMLDWLVEKTKGLGLLCDMGCGPGQIARYIHDNQAQICGVDISDEMVRQAQRLHPNIPFQQGTMLALTTIAEASYGGIAAFYSIIHIPRLKVVEALLELNRVLVPQGVLLLTFHIGQQSIHRDEWWGKEVSVDFNFFETQDMKQHLKEANFTLEEVIERDPYSEQVEYQSRRAYIFARKA